jgi:hypothetical protein
MHDRGADTPPDDPVLRRRSQVLWLTSLGQRVGYGCFAAALVLFFVGLALQFPAWLVSTVVTLLVVGSVVLLPAIILSYAAKAADKEDRGEPFGY